jgi:hypothetical protein
MKKRCEMTLPKVESAYSADMRDMIKSRGSEYFIADCIQILLEENPALGNYIIQRTIVTKACMPATLPLLVYRILRFSAERQNLQLPKVSEELASKIGRISPEDLARLEKENPELAKVIVLGGIGLDAMCCLTHMESRLETTINIYRMLEMTAEQ